MISGLGAEERIWTSAALFTRPTPLAGEPLRPLGYFRMVELHIRFGSWNVAERVGFEPTDAFTSPVFKTGSLNRSDISPNRCQVQVEYYHTSLHLSTLKCKKNQIKIFGKFEKKTCILKKSVILWIGWQREQQQLRKSGCGEVWYRAWMGFKRPRVRISTLGPNRCGWFAIHNDCRKVSIILFYKQ